MTSAQPYAERVLFALGEALTDASTETATRIVTYRRADALAHPQALWPLFQSTMADRATHGRPRRNF